MKQTFLLSSMLLFCIYSWGQNSVIQDSLQRYNEDQEKLFRFVKNSVRGPLLVIDSLVAVDSLQVLPSSYHLFLENLRWKKKYSVEDFLKIMKYVRKSDNNRLFIAIDSVTAVNNLKIDPFAYRDLKNNLQDYNRVTIYNENISLLKQYVRKVNNKWMLMIDSITAVDSLRISIQAYKDLVSELNNRN